VIPLKIIVTAGGIGLFFHWFGYCHTDQDIEARAAVR